MIYSLGILLIWFSGLSIGVYFGLWRDLLALGMKYHINS